MADRKIRILIAKPDLERVSAAAHSVSTSAECRGVLREEFGEYKEPKTL